MTYILTLFFTLTAAVAENSVYYDYAKVTRSEPIYEYVYERIPQEECIKEKVPVYHHTRKDQNSNAIGLDTIIGATTGVVIGNQIGKGNGRTAAKIIGGIMGGAIANNLRDRPSYEHQGYDYEIRTRCYDRSKSVQRKMLTGYKNYFYYKGQEYSKITHKAKKRIKITHSIDF